MSNFPYALASWSLDDAQRIAQQEHLELDNNRLDVVRSLQEYYSRHDSNDINVRELHDALDERFHRQGGMKYLYRLFPGGPVAQGCRIAGLEAPAGAVDRSFGSVQ